MWAYTENRSTSCGEHSVQWITFALMALLIVTTYSREVAAVTAVSTGGPVTNYQFMPTPSFDLCAHSNKTAPAPPVGPNAAVVSTVLPVVTCTKLRVFVGGMVPVPFGPFMGRENVLKPAAPPLGAPSLVDSVMSTSAPVVGKAEHTRLPGAANAAIKLHADGTVPVGVAGTAGGISRDPGDIAPGLYDYRFDIDQLSLQTDDELDFAAVAFFGEDSRFVDPLWSLTVILDGLLSDITDVNAGVKVHHWPA